MMAGGNGGGGGGEGEDDDYMGDLSAFLPPDATASTKKQSGSRGQAPEASRPKRPKRMNWQERRRLDRERQQREEDEQTLAGLQAAIPPSNVGFKMLQRMGYNPGTALGREGSGQAEPVGLEIRRSRAGIGVGNPKVEKVRKEREVGEKKRKWEEEMMAEFGSKQKTQWRSRRVLGDYRKAEAALAQLENREVVEPQEDEGDEKEEEEEEEEQITEEDLHDILMKLRDEHQYCLHCGCQYESAEAMESNCPGPSEDDH